MTEFFPIQTPYSSKDYEIMKNVINMGIDSNLQGFTKSEFKKSPNFNNKFLWNIHTSELPILYRRLEELYAKTNDDDYQSFLDDIKYSVGETETVEEMIDPYDPMDANQTTDGYPTATSDLKGPEFQVEANIEQIEEGYGDRYEKILFAQGGEADEIMDVLNNDGEEAALDFMKQWHYPGEHDGSNEVGAGKYDDRFEKDGYIMSWNSRMPYIGLILVLYMIHNTINQQ